MGERESFQCMHVYIYIYVFIHVHIMYVCVTSGLYKNILLYLLFIC